MKRRDLIKLGLTASTFLFGPRTGAAAARLEPAAGEAPAVAEASAPQVSSRPERADADYIVVGSGAGGGTVAARLAEAGFTVLLLEAGGDPRDSTGSTPQTPGVNSLRDDYDVPAFHALATENDGMRWDFFVRHYENQTQQELDPNYRKTYDGKPVDGVLYPRAGTLGGCTAHNAMILVYPHDADWDQIADVTSDPTWRAGNMRGYFERIEQCRHRPLERFWSRFGRNPSRHGWSGWLNTEVAIPRAAIRNRDLHDSVRQSARDAFDDPSLGFSDDDRRSRLQSRFDPNDARVVADNAVGLRYTPLTTKNHQRVGTRERVLDVNRRFPARLKIQLNALATRVLFDGQKRAIGVEYQDGARLYGAAPRASATPGATRQVFAAREVILAGGAFNTPQLLMLSGIGPREELEKHGIGVVSALDGVGRNLQDRYEVAVVNRMNFPAWEPLDGATFTNADPQYKAWADSRDGVYKTNGAILSVVARSSVAAPVPDLFLYALLGKFEGYFPGYSSQFAKNPNCLTWVVLKAHTNNTAGRVTLRSTDPRTPPDINFRYFAEGSDGHIQDADAVAAGMKLARRLAAGLKRDKLIANEEFPGDTVADDKLADFARNHAWGHHASCTCRIGPEDRGGVLSGDFKVHGVQGLRVVDASVFPRIPGYFIVSAVYMIAEKAADAIIADARGTGLTGLLRRLVPSRTTRTT